MEVSAFDTNRYASRLVAAGESMEIANIHAEALGELRQAILNLDAKVEQYHAEDLVAFASIRTQLYELDARVTKELAEQRVLIAGQDSKLAAMDGKFAVMDGKLAVMDGRLTAMDAKIDSLESKMEARISALEKKLMRWILTVGVALGLVQSALALAPRYIG